MNEIINLPQDIFENGAGLNGPITFHDYVAHAKTFKGKSIMHQNAISLVISGEKTMHFADRTVHINSNEFHFLSAGNCVASMVLSDQTVFRSVLIFFDNESLSGFHLKYHGLISKVSNRSDIVKAKFVAFKKDLFTKNYIESLTVLCQSGKTFSPAMRQLKFEELLLHLLENYPEKLLSFRGAERYDFSDVAMRTVVETHINTAINIEELAFLCNTSLSTFKRRFGKMYGTSPSKWLLQQRMEMAKNLLTHFNEKPSEIYHKLGYDSHSSFSESFKNAFGITPKEYQAQELTHMP